MEDLALAFQVGYEVQTRSGWCPSLQEFPGVTTMERNTVGHIRRMLKRGVYKVPGSQCGSCCCWW